MPTLSYRGYDVSFDHSPNQKEVDQTIAYLDSLPEKGKREEGFAEGVGKGWMQTGAETGRALANLTGSETLKDLTQEAVDYWKPEEDVDPSKWGRGVGGMVQGVSEFGLGGGAGKLLTNAGKVEKGLEAAKGMSRLGAMGTLAKSGAYNTAIGGAASFASLDAMRFYNHLKEQGVPEEDAMKAAAARFGGDAVMAALPPALMAGRAGAALTGAAMGGGLNIPQAMVENKILEDYPQAQRDPYDPVALTLGSIAGGVFGVAGRGPGITSRAMEGEFKSAEARFADEEKEFLGILGRQSEKTEAEIDSQLTAFGGPMAPHLGQRIADPKLRTKEFEFPPDSTLDRSRLPIAKQSDIDADVYSPEKLRYAQEARGQEIVDAMSRRRQLEYDAAMADLAARRKAEEDAMWAEHLAPGREMEPSYGSRDIEQVSNRRDNLARQHTLPKELRPDYKPTTKSPKPPRLGEEIQTHEAVNPYLNAHGREESPAEQSTQIAKDVGRYTVETARNPYAHLNDPNYQGLGPDVATRKTQNPYDLPKQQKEALATQIAQEVGAVRDPISGQFLKKPVDPQGRVDDDAPLTPEGLPVNGEKNTLHQQLLDAGVPPSFLNWMRERYAAAGKSWEYQKGVYEDMLSKVQQGRLPDYLSWAERGGWKNPENNQKADMVPSKAVDQPLNKTLSQKLNEALSTKLLVSPQSRMYYGAQAARSKEVVTASGAMIKALGMLGNRDMFVMTLTDARRMGLEETFPRPEDDSPMWHTATKNGKSVIIIDESKFALSTPTEKRITTVGKSRSQTEYERMWKNRERKGTVDVNERDPFIGQTRLHDETQRDNTTAPVSGKKSGQRSVDEEILSEKISRDNYSIEKTLDEIQRTTQWTEEKSRAFLKEHFGEEETTALLGPEGTFGKNWKEGETELAGRLGDETTPLNFTQANRIRLYMGLAHEVGHAFMYHTLNNSHKIVGKDGNTIFDNLVSDFVKWVSRQNDPTAFVQKHLAQPDLLGEIGRTQFTTSTKTDGVTVSREATGREQERRTNLAQYFGYEAHKKLTEQQKALLNKRTSELLHDNAAFASAFKEFFAEQIARGLSRGKLTNTTPKTFVAEAIDKLRNAFKEVINKIYQSFGIKLTENDVMVPFMQRFMDEWNVKYADIMAEKARNTAIAHEDAKDVPAIGDTKVIDNVMSSEGLPGISTVAKTKDEIIQDIKQRGIKDVRQLTANYVRKFFGSPQLIKIAMDHPVLAQTFQRIWEVGAKYRSWEKDMLHGQVDKSQLGKIGTLLFNAEKARQVDSLKNLLRINDESLNRIMEVFRDGFRTKSYQQSYQDAVAQGRLVTQQEKQLFIRLSNTFESMHKIASDQLSQSGSKVNINKVEGWYPAVRTGPYVLMATKADGTTYLQGYANRGDMHKDIKKFGKDGFDVQHWEETPGQYGSLGGELRKRILDEVNGLPQEDAVRKLMEQDMLTPSGFGGGKADLSKHFNYRENYLGARGFEKYATPKQNADNFRGAITQDIGAYARFAHNIELMRVTEPIIGKASGMDEVAPNARAMGEALRDHALGKSIDPVLGAGGDKLLTLMAELTRGVINLPARPFGKKIMRTDVDAFHQMNNQFSQMFYIWALTTRPAFMLSQLTSPLLGLRAISRLGVENPDVKFWKGALEGSHALISRKQDFMEFYAWAQEHTETFQPQLVADMNRVELFRKNPTMEKVWEWISGQTPSQAADSFSRVQTSAMMFYALKDSPQFKTKEDLYRKVAMETDAAMISYRMSDRPELYKDLGKAGELAGPLTTFYHGSLGNYVADLSLLRQVKEYGPKAAVPLLMSQAVLLMMGGVLGVVGYAEAELFIMAANWALKMSGSDTHLPSLYELMVKMDDSSLGGQLGKDIAIHGIPSATTGVDVGASMRAAPIVSGIIDGRKTWIDLFPQLSFMLKQGGAAATKVRHELWEKTGIGRPATSAELNEATKQIVPGGYRGVARALGAFEEQNTGLTQGSQRGYGGVPFEKEEQIAEFLGSRSLDQSKSQRAMSQFRGHERARIQTKEDAVDWIVDGFMQGEDDKVTKGMDAATKLGMTSKQVREAVMNAYKNRITPEMDRTYTKGGKFGGTNEQKRKYNYMDPYIRNYQDK